MFNPSEVHRLDTDRFAALHGGATRTLKKRPYIGKLLVSGADAAIEVVGDQVVTLVGGRTDHTNELFDQIVIAYRPALLAAAKKLRKRATDRIVIAGIWHNAFLEHPPYLEPYLLHIIDEEGNVTSRRYDLQVFGWDKLGDGPQINLVLGKTDGEMVEMALQYVTEGHINIESPQLSSKGLPIMQGIQRGRGAAP